MPYLEKQTKPKRVNDLRRHLPPHGADRRLADSSGRDQQHRGLQRLRGAHRFGGPAAAAGAGDAEPRSEVMLTPG